MNRPISPIIVVPDSFQEPQLPEIVHYNAPDILPDSTAGHECSICLDDLGSSESVIVKNCQHTFHQACISHCLNSHSNSCPVCRGPIGEPQGKGPSGTMTVRTKDQTCPGFGTSTTLEIRYKIPNGTQESYHDHPGVRYSGTTRIAYLPDNDEGRKLLQRLQYSFMHGLNFAVGTSLTTHQSDVTTWTSIHHKTSLYGGTHGFPDDAYLDNCNECLDALNVPKDCPVQPRQLTYKAPKQLLESSLLSMMERYHVSTVTQSTDKEPQGKCPSASMTMEKLSKPCPGYYNTACIRIIYYIPGGVQKPYHPNPGASYPDTTRVCYLPDNIDGYEILRRLRYAFLHGLIFHIGTSFTSKRDNQVVWSGIPHKTSLDGGEFGFPDPSYIDACHDKLDEFHVPEADLCL